MLFWTCLLIVLLANKTYAISSHIPVKDIPLSRKVGWCNSQIPARYSTCNDSISSNSCSPDTLEWECKCRDGQAQAMRGVYGGIPVMWSHYDIEICIENAPTENERNSCELDGVVVIGTVPSSPDRTRAPETLTTVIKPVSTSVLSTNIVIPPATETALSVPPSPLQTLSLAYTTSISIQPTPTASNTTPDAVTSPGSATNLNEASPQCGTTTGTNAGIVVGVVVGVGALVALAYLIFRWGRKSAKQNDAVTEGHVSQRHIIASELAGSDWNPHGSPELESSTPGSKFYEVPAFERKVAELPA